MTIAEIVTLITNNGFAVGMCIYLVVRMENTLNKNTNAINNVSAFISARFGEEVGKKNE